MSSVRSQAVKSTPELWRERAKRLSAQKQNLPELFGAKETARCLSEAGEKFKPPLPIVNVANLQFIADLPGPVPPDGSWEVAATRLWLADEIRAFAEIYAQRRHDRRNSRRNGS